MSEHQTALVNLIKATKTLIDALTVEENVLQKEIYTINNSQYNDNQHNENMKNRLAYLNNRVNVINEIRTLQYLNLSQFKEDLNQPKGGRKNGKRKSITMKGRNKKGKKGSRMVLKSSRKTSRKR